MMDKLVINVAYFFRLELEQEVLQIHLPIYQLYYLSTECNAMQLCNL